MVISKQSQLSFFISLNLLFPVFYLSITCFFFISVLLHRSYVTILFLLIFQSAAPSWSFRRLYLSHILGFFFLYAWLWRQLVLIAISFVPVAAASRSATSCTSSSCVRLLSHRHDKSLLLSASFFCQHRYWLVVLQVATAGSCLYLGKFLRCVRFFLCICCMFVALQRGLHSVS